MARPQISAFFDEPTNTVSYLVADPASRQAAVIDPLLDYDPASGDVETRSAEAVLAAAEEQGLTVALVLETHPHADHLSAAMFFKERTGARIGIGAGICAVQKEFAPLFGAVDDGCDGSDFDLLLEDGQQLPLGELAIEVIATPGHTPACVCYKVGDAVFVGDTLFMPDYGTARCDFPGGCAHRLYHSMQRILALPPETRLFMCHDYKAPGRDRFAWRPPSPSRRRATSISAAASARRIMSRCARHAMPSFRCPMLLPAMQVNIRAGRLPPAEANGMRYLRIPFKLNGLYANQSFN